MTDTALELENTAESETRIENLKEFISVAAEFEKNEEGNTIVNSVIGINTTSFKSIIPDAFPLANIKNIIPDILYISSTNEVIKGEESFEYNVEHVDFTINNLSKEQTESFFYALDTLMGVGSAEYINVQIGTTLMHALVGNGANKGLAYSLKEYGAKDFNFVQHGSDIYFEVQR